MSTSKRSLDSMSDGSQNDDSGLSAGQGQNGSMLSQDILHRLLSDLNSADSSIIDCGLASVSLLGRTVRTLFQNDHKKALAFSESLISLATEKFYAYPYKDVPSCWRRLHVDASIVKSIARQRQGQELKDIVEPLDMALIMAGGEGRQKEIHKLLDSLDITPTKKRKLDVPEKFDISPPTVSLKYPIERRSAPSISSFEHHMNQHHTPLILTDCISHWPALDLWTHPSHLLNLTLNGTRIVPIELGSSYTATSWSQKLIPFSTFLHTHLLHPSKVKGYLAQHDLLSQIPGFHKDISTPEYCYTETPRTSPDVPRVGYVATEDVMRNIWMGPEGTRSPLHNDPYENIFAQVVGYKYFRLYPPCETESVYPRGVEGGIQMGNTSQVDVENPDLERFPMFDKAGYVEGVLGPGEYLYVPV